MGRPCDEWCAELERVNEPGIRVLPGVWPDVDASVLAAFHTAAEPLGYVLVDARLDLPEPARRLYWHRHVVLIHRGAGTPASVRWVRELSQASPRAHAVLLLAEWPDRAHEASPARLRALEPMPLPSGLGRQARRADRFDQCHRRRAAERWMGAAMESARRACDDSGAAAAFVRLAGLTNTVEVGQAEGLLSRGRRLLSGLSDLGARSHVVAVLADLWITLGEFETAAAALAAVDVECAIVRAEVPAWIRTRQCELACWRGRWDQAHRHARESRHAGWRTLAAFGCRDWSSLRGDVPAVGGTQVEWDGLVSAMCAAAAGNQAGVVEALEEIGRHEGPARWRDAITLEALEMSGAAAQAEQWRQAVAGRSRGPAEQVLWNWVTRTPAAAGRSAAEEGMRRVGADGVRRWGMGRSTMQVWAGVSSLLQQVHEADDPAAALQRGCRWTREYTGADFVAVVSHDRSIVVACEPAERRDDALVVVKRHAETVSADALIVESMRYGGVRAGSVILGGEPRDAAEARSVVRALAIACAPALRARLDDMALSGAGETLGGELLGVSPAMRALRDAVARAAGSTFPVLIEGESGTGKELVARALHRLSPRRDRRWAAVNCAALTDELLESELFGHTRGAFTGALQPRVGLLEDAHEGTLFLDEVGELSPRGQAKLLRVLQEGEIRRVGENVSRRVDVRLVAATNRPLVAAAQRGDYREDLMFRLAVIRLRVPPLRDRIEDVPLLAHAFWRTTASRAGTQAVLGPDAVAGLCRSTWPGNVRELQNAIAALAISGPSRGRVGARHVAAVLAERSDDAAVTAPLSLAAARGQADRRVVAASLARHGGRQAAAARELGVSRQGLAKLIARLQAAGA